MWCSWIHLGASVDRQVNSISQISGILTSALNRGLNLFSRQPTGSSCFRQCPGAGRAFAAAAIEEHISRVREHGLQANGDVFWDVSMRHRHIGKLKASHPGCMFHRLRGRLIKRFAIGSKVNDHAVAVPDCNHVINLELAGDRDTI